MRGELAELRGRVASRYGGRQRAPVVALVVYRDDFAFHNAFNHKFDDTDFFNGDFIFSTAIARILTTYPSLVAVLSGPSSRS